MDNVMADNEKIRNNTRAQTLKQSMGDIGKFRIILKLDSGGAGTVYKCYDPDLQVYRAIKIPLGQRDETDRQLHEARIQAGIIHPNILQVYSVEQIDGQWAIIMDYADGGSLRHRLAAGAPVPVKDAVECTRQIASALKIAHQNNVLHHDIKPENILFSSDGTPKLADFGIARIVQTAKKDMSKIMGTTAYMAPEQLEGKADLRSDIWSLGVVFYEMLTGSRCFEGQTDPETMKKIVMDKPLPVCRLNPSIPIRIENVVMKMLEKNPDKRYQKMDAVIKDLEGVHEAQNVAKKKKIGIAIPVVAVIAFMVAGTIFLTHNDNIIRKQLPTQKDVVEPVKAEAPETPKEISAPDKSEVPAPRKEPEPGAGLGNKENDEEAPVQASGYAGIPGDLKNLPVTEQLKIASDYIKEEKFESAYQLFTYVNLNATNPKLRTEAKFKRASLALHYMDRSDQALADFLELIENSDERSTVGDSHYFAGMIYYEIEKDLKKAIKHLSILIGQYPEHPNIETAKFIIQEADKSLIKRQGG